VRLPAARLALGPAVLVLVGWVAGALVTALVGSGGLDAVRDVAGERSAGLTAAAQAATWTGSAFVLVPLALVCCQEASVR
jgi:hypothetical protein